MREVLGDFGWIDTNLEVGKKWIGGTLRLIPGKEDTQPKEIPIEAFIKKRNYSAWHAPIALAPMKGRICGANPGRKN